MKERGQAGKDINYLGSVVSNPKVVLRFEGIKSDRKRGGREEGRGNGEVRERGDCGMYGSLKLVKPFFVWMTKLSEI